MTPYLPHQDPNPSDRQQYLASNRQHYQYNYQYYPPIPLLDQVPKAEFFSVKYTAERLASAADLAPNLLAAKARNFFDPLDELDEYADLLPVLPKPNLSQYYRTDEFFGEQRLSGADPMAIRRIDEIPSDFSVTDEHLQQVLGTTYTLQTALQAKLLYFLEFPLLSHIQGGDYANGKKWMPKPRALFAWRRDSNNSGALLPIAIDLETESPGTHLLYTPQDLPTDWLFAKTCVQIADASYQELGFHFSYAHAVMAPFAITTARQLGETHPITLLLKPHFRFMLHDNDLGRTQFLQPNGPVDHFMPGTLQESLQFIIRFYQTWHLFDSALEKQIASRQMDDVTVLPHYPFRDDGLMVWDAVKLFVSEYIQLYYKTPQDLSQDEELQQWAEELASENGGRVNGMPAKLETVDQLIEVLTMVVFTCGPLHSALNFAQYEYMAYVPNMPYAAYQPTPSSKGMDMTTFLKVLPPFKQAMEQITWTHILTSYHYDKLGFYDEKFDDSLAQEAVVRFQQALALIDREIDIRNQNRKFPYVYFKPSQAINSINT